MDANCILPRHLHFRDTTGWNNDVHTMSILLEKCQEGPPGQRTSVVFRQNPHIRPRLPREHRSHFMHLLIERHNIHEYNYSVTWYGAQTTSYHAHPQNLLSETYCPPGLNTHIKG